MAEQFVNPVETKVQDKTVADTSAQKRIDKVAEQLALKPAKTEKHFDKENSNPFSK
jgi:hypothetical protein